jgi:hypothetical protein
MIKPLKQPTLRDANGDIEHAYWSKWSGPEYLVCERQPPPDFPLNYLKHMLEQLPADPCTLCVEILKERIKKHDA